MWSLVAGLMSSWVALPIDFRAGVAGFSASCAVRNTIPTNLAAYVTPLTSERLEAMSVNVEFVGMSM